VCVCVIQRVKANFFRNLLFYFLWCLCATHWGGGTIAHPADMISYDKVTFIISVCRSVGGVCLCSHGTSCCRSSYNETCTRVFVRAAQQDIVEGNGDGDGERLYRCHPHYRLCRESSLSTLTGEELEAFADTLPIDGQSVHDSCGNRNFL